LAAVDHPPVSEAGILAVPVLLFPAIHGDAVARHKQQSLKRSLIFAAKLAIAAGVLALLVRSGLLDVRKLSQNIAGGWHWISLSIGLFLVVITVTAWRWNLLLRAQGIEIPYMLAVRLTFVGLFFSAVMPGGTGGDLAKAYYVLRWGKKRAAAVTTIFLDRVIGMYCMLGIATVMVLGQAKALWSQPESRPLVYLIPLFFLVKTAVLAALFTEPVRRIMTATRSGPPIMLGEKFHKVYLAVDLYRESKATILWAMLLSLVSISTICLSFMAFGMALGDMKTEAVQYLLVVPVGMVVNGLPILPMGLGVSEVAFEILFKVVSGSPTGAESGLLFHIVVIFWCAISAFFYLSMRTGLKAATSSAELEEDGPPESERNEEEKPSIDYRGKQLKDYAGAVHLHTTYSDGSQPIDKVLKQAKRCGLDFVVVTDHDTLQASKDSWVGWNDGVLTLVGVEVSPLDGHSLVLGLKECEGLDEMSPPDYLREVRERGALSIIAHPEARPRPEFTFKAREWNHWDCEDFDGLEVWSYMHDWIRGVTRKNLIFRLLDPTKNIQGPDPEVLARWDSLGQTRRVIGLGGIDNHARNLPFRRLPVYLVQVLPYRFVFETLRTHVLAETFSSDAEKDIPRVMDALRQGHCYVAYDYLAQAQGFRFEAHDGENLALMGDEVPATGEYDLRVRSPEPAELTLLRNGEVLSQTNSDSLDAKTREPGVYRVEARLNGTPWVFTNPIYLR